ncbi:20802_t:CDS:2, partial [Gigaspora rosea]
FIISESPWRTLCCHCHSGAILSLVLVSSFWNHLGVNSTLPSSFKFPMSFWYVV